MYSLDELKNKIIFEYKQKGVYETIFNQNWSITGYRVDVRFTDFSKAFDKVDRTITISKLHGIMLVLVTLFFCGFLLALPIENKLSSTNILNRFHLQNHFLQSKEIVKFKIRVKYFYKKSLFAFQHFLFSLKSIIFLFNIKHCFIVINIKTTHLPNTII